jgi:hypothetical protein
MSDADRKWTIEHVEEQLYDVTSLLDITVSNSYTKF